MLANLRYCIITAYINLIMTLDYCMYNIPQYMGSVSDTKKCHNRHTFFTWCVYCNIFGVTGTLHLLQCAIYHHLLLELSLMQSSHLPRLDSLTNLLWVFYHKYSVTVTYTIVCVAVLLHWHASSDMMSSLTPSCEIQIPCMCWYYGNTFTPLASRSCKIPVTDIHDE